MNTLKLTVEDKIAVLEINRPEALNAINEEVMEELNAVLDHIADRCNTGEIGGLILTGSGKAFVAGADIKVQSTFDEAGGYAWGKNGCSVFGKLEKLDVPVIAAVNGFALGGGGELALACDIIVAGEKAKFGQPEVGLGITPGFGGTQRLPRRIGMGKAKELIFSGRMVTAAEAEAIGLADKVVPQEELLNACIDMMNSFLKNGPKAVAYSKHAMNDGAGKEIDEALAVENKYFSWCFNTEDQKEGMIAFLEKRKAVFQNK